jgi:SAM-dependent methyltransferase
MDVALIASRKRLPRPFVETSNLPWHDPSFSRRALREQLNQDHDSGTRSESIVRTQVEFIVEQLQLSPGDTVLDLTCGPGLYAKHISAYGCSVVGIDISPAAIEYARQLSLPRSKFIHGDVRSVDYPSNLDGVILIYGALNTFSPHDAELVLRKIARSLKPSRRLILELCNTSCLYARDTSALFVQGWWCSDRGDLWSDGPYVALKERLYYPNERVEVTRYFIISENSHKVEEYTETCISYDLQTITEMLNRAGLVVESVHRSLSNHPAPSNHPANPPETSEEMFLVIVASKP